MQTQNIIVLNHSTVESKLIRMKDLDTQIKILEAELKMLKTEVINDYFVTNSSYQTSKGLILATYISFSQKQFQQSQFKKDNQNLYDLYTEEKTIFKFSLK